MYNLEKTRRQTQDTPERLRALFVKREKNGSVQKLQAEQNLYISYMHVGNSEHTVQTKSPPAFKHEYISCIFLWGGGAGF